MLTPEQQVRQLIDAQLATAGWLVQNYKQLNMGAPPGIAVRETLRLPARPTMHC
jgi:type I restriction enzyme R subunit